MPIPLDKMVEEATFIGVIRIDTIEAHKFKENHLVVNFTVIDTWKGESPLRYIFDKTNPYACDITPGHSNIGEESVAFLWNHYSETYVSHNGRGLMPIKIQEGASFAEFRPEVKMPKAEQTIKSGDSSFIRLIDLEILKGLVQGAQ